MLDERVLKLYKTDMSELYIDDGGDIVVSSEVTEYGEHHQPGEDRGEGVAEPHDEGVPVAVVMELVVAGERQLTAVAHREGEEYLRSCSAPDLG